MEKDDLQTILVNSINNDPTLNLLAKTGIIIFILFLIIVLVIILIRYFKGV